MGALLISFLKSHWPTALVVSLALTVVTVFSLQRLEIRHLSGKLAQCRGENVSLENSNKALLMSVSEQNEAVSRLQAKARSKKNAAARALSNARTAASLHIGKAREILMRKSSGNECADLKELVNAYIGDRRR